MKVRFKEQSEDVEPSWASRFNMQALSEVVVQGDWGADSVYLKDLDVYLEATGEWKDLCQAFHDHDVIVDNFNSHFFEPDNEEDRARGFTL